MRLYQNGRLLGHIQNPSIPVHHWRHGLRFAALPKRPSVHVSAFRGAETYKEKEETPLCRMVKLFHPLHREVFVAVLLNGDPEIYPAEASDEIDEAMSQMGSEA